MTRIGVATTLSFDALRQLLFEYPKQAYISQLLHLKVIADIFVVENGSWSVGDPLITAMDACLPSLLVLDGW